MAFPYIPLLILCGLIGIHSITTVRKVSVKAGGSISIPCLYDARYINHVKCLCRGYYWNSCSYVVKTNQSSNSGKFSISDDTKQRIFTVTINNLVQDTSYYWCAVEIKYRADVKKKFSLDVSADKPSLYVDQQEITGFEGGNMTVRCHYTGSSTQMKWYCGLNGTCVKGQSGYINGARVTINASVSDVFIVTMSELKIESSGWYLCRKGNLQMPVHLTVHKQTSTTTTTMSPTTTISSTTTKTLPTTHQLSSLLTSAEPSTAQPTNSTAAGAGGDNLPDQHQSSIDLKILLIPLILLALVVAAALFGWRMIIHKKAKTEASAITVAADNEQKIIYSDVLHIMKTPGQGPQTGSDPDVLYSTVVHDQHRKAQEQDQTPEDGVTYSTIEIKNGTSQKTEPAEASVIYSTVVPH